MTAVAPLVRRRALPRLTPLEVASGMLLGRRPVQTPETASAAPGAALPPRAALNEVLLPAVTRPPCFVAFSGGRDSSAMLAAATSLARVHGLPDPIPLTNRFPGHEQTHEAEWQELVVRHLRLRDWVTLDLGDELDLVGPLGAATLRDYGLIWPPNAHTISLLLQEAAGGSLITGNGGDEVLTPWRGRRLAAVRAGRLRPTRGDLERLALAMAPEALRRLAWRLRRPIRLPWLTSEGNRQLAWVVARSWSELPSTWLQQIEGLLSARYLHVAMSALHAFAEDAGTLLVQPFLDPRFAIAVARDMPQNGPPNRAAALERYFGDLLPDGMAQRSTKARFTEVFWGPQTRAFAAGWDGSGVDMRLIDVERLRAIWMNGVPDLRSMTALQAAWLAQC